jgi:hypothetical protein
VLARKRTFATGLGLRFRRSVPARSSRSAVSKDDFGRLNQALVRLERFWTDQIRYRL